MIYLIKLLQWLCKSLRRVSGHWFRQSQLHLYHDSCTEIESSDCKLGLFLSCTYIALFAYAFKLRCLGRFIQMNVHPHKHSPSRWLFPYQLATCASACCRLRQFECGRCRGYDLDLGHLFCASLVGKACRWRGTGNRQLEPLIFCNEL